MCIYKEESHLSYQPTNFPLKKNIQIHTIGLILTVNNKPEMDDDKRTSAGQSAATQDQLETLPGFRFHPTEEELLDFYLKRMVFGKKLRHDIIGFLNIYRHDPRDLPGLAKVGEREWYFFVPMDRKHGHGGRPNRTTEHGFWKATGSDRTIRSLADPKRIIGLRKTLVFYEGRAPRGCKTDWVMNEYRMPQNCTLPMEDIVLCKIYRKATSMRVLEQRAAMEEEMQSSQMVFSSSPPSTVSDYNIPSFEHQNSTPTLVTQNDIFFKMEDEEEHEQEEHEQEEHEQELEDVISEENIEQKEKKTDMTVSTGRAPSLLRVGLGENENLPILQLPKVNMDWTQDLFWTQLHSPWLDNWLLNAL